MPVCVVLSDYLVGVEEEFKDSCMVPGTEEVWTVFPVVMIELPCVLVEGGTLE
jgi:hypothetical protein